MCCPSDRTAPVRVWVPSGVLTITGVGCWLDVAPMPSCPLPFGPHAAMEPSDRRTETLPGHAGHGGVHAAGESCPAPPTSGTGAEWPQLHTVPSSRIATLKPPPSATSMTWSRLTTGTGTARSTVVPSPTAPNPGVFRPQPSIFPGTPDSGASAVDGSQSSPCRCLVSLLRRG